MKIIPYAISHLILVIYIIFSMITFTYLAPIVYPFLLGTSENNIISVILKPIFIILITIIELYIKTEISIMYNSFNYYKLFNLILIMLLILQKKKKIKLNDNFIVLIICFIMILSCLDIFIYIRNYYPVFLPTNCLDFILYFIYKFNDAILMTFFLIKSFNIIII